MKHSVKENGDCPHWCKACAAERLEREKLGKYGPTASLADDRNAESPSERFLRLFDASFESCSQKGARSIARDRALRRHREGDLDGACRDLLAAVEARTKREPGIEAELREMCGVSHWVGFGCRCDIEWQSENWADRCVVCRREAEET